MRRINRDSLPHLADCFARNVAQRFWTVVMRGSALWWDVQLDQDCSFRGITRFRRHPGSSITIAVGCTFNSASKSNLIGINRPCMLSTLKEGAVLEIGPDCGLSGTVIGCARRIILRDNVRCGANTLITDTDWHTDDPRSGPDAPVVIESGVWLGVNVTVLKGVTIGANTVIGAGSIVTHSIPANCVAAGVPARVLKPPADSN